MSRVRSTRMLLIGVLACCGVMGMAVAAPAQSCKAGEFGEHKHDCRRTPIQSGRDQVDTLTENDIPTGEGGFFRDYQVDLSAGDNVAIDLISQEFDPIVSLIKPDGTPMGNNDDGPGGETDSLLFVRIKESGSYIVRVAAFGETGGGEFTLTVTRLVPAN